MKVTQLSESRSQFTLEAGDVFSHEVGAADWKGRILLARHFLRVAWIVLRRGRVVHSIHGGEGPNALEDILDAEYLGEE